jgi:hypothetical protein
VTVEHPLTGVYNIDVNTTITNCAYVATLGDPGSASFPVGIVSVKYRAGFTDQIVVNGWDADDRKDDGGTLKDRGFHVAVHC